MHDDAYLTFLRGAWEAWRALGRSHPALPMIWHAGQGLPRVLPRHIDGQLGCFSFDGGSAIVEGTWLAAYWSANADGEPARGRCAPVRHRHSRCAARRATTRLPR